MDVHGARQIDDQLCVTHLKCFSQIQVSQALKICIVLNGSHRVYDDEGGRSRIHPICAVSGS